MKMNFPIERHYFSQNYYPVAQKKVDTAFGSYRIYDVERSICDLVRLGRIEEAEIIFSKAGYGTQSLEGILSMGNEAAEQERYRRLLKYAELFRVRRV